jgi:hypothetical protein
LFAQVVWCTHFSLTHRIVRKLTTGEWLWSFYRSIYFGFWEKNTEFRFLTNIIKICATMFWYTLDKIDYGVFISQYILDFDKNLQSFDFLTNIIKICATVFWYSLDKIDYGVFIGQYIFGIWQKITEFRFF